MPGQNELILLATLIVVFGSALLAYKYFGRAGLYCVSAIATVLANIEVLILIKAFGLTQTLGNVLFAVTFLITDILSECEGKKYANKAVMIGIFTSVFFLVISQSWLLYAPSSDDWAFPFISEIFTNTPRMVLASLSVYAISQVFDVWLYHKWWQLTEKKSGNKRKYLWLRNNGSTLVSQLINTVLFNVVAFAGTYDFKTLMTVIGSGYLIFVFTSLLDTPAVYLARRISDKKKGLLVSDALFTLKKQ